MDSEIAKKKLGGPPIAGDILVFNEYTYMAVVNPLYEGRDTDPKHQLGLGYMWVPINNNNAPQIPYDKRNVIPVEWIGEVAIKWELIDKSVVESA